MNRGRVNIWYNFFEVLLVIVAVFFILTMAILFAGKPDLHDKLIEYADKEIQEKGCP